MCYIAYVWHLPVPHRSTVAKRLEKVRKFSQDGVCVCVGVYLCVCVGVYVCVACAHVEEGGPMVQDEEEKNT